MSMSYLKRNAPKNGSRLKIWLNIKMSLSAEAKAHWTGFSKPIVLTLEEKAIIDG